MAIIIIVDLATHLSVELLSAGSGAPLSAVLMFPGTPPDASH